MLRKYFPPEGQMKLEAFRNGESHSSRALSGRALNILSIMKDFSMGKRNVIHLYQHVALGSVMSLLVLMAHILYGRLEWTSTTGLSQLIFIVSLHLEGHLGGCCADRSGTQYLVQS